MNSEPPQLPTPEPAAPVMSADYQSMKDAEHLKLLSIFHYVYSGLMFLTSLWPLIYVVMGLFFIMAPSSTFSENFSDRSTVETTEVLSDHAEAPDVEPPAVADLVEPLCSEGQSDTISGSDAAEAAMMGWFFVGLGTLASLLILVMAILTLIAGRRLSARRSRVFILVIACVNLMSFPLGTALGVFTLIVLLRPSVVTLFEERKAASTSSV